MPPMAITVPTYDDFFRSIAFTDSLGGYCSPRRVPTDCQITVTFKPNVDLNCFVTEKNDPNPTSLSMVDVFGARWAKER